jgi:PKD repeat protein
VTVTAPPANSLAQDAFGRTLASGWGTADLGGAWTITGNAASLSVGSGVGKISISPGSTRTAVLGSLSSTDSDTQVTMSLGSVPTGNGSFTDVIGRKVGSSLYIGEVWVKSTGAVYAVLEQGSGVLKTAQVAGLTYTAGTQLQVRLQTTGISPTTIRMKVWPVGQTEPSAWLVTATDTTAALQAAGSVGLQSSLSGSATTPVVTSFDNLAVNTSTAPVNQPPTAAFTSSATGLAASFNGTTSTDVDGTIASYAWNYGDSATGTGVTSSHSYAAAGTYTVSLTVTDNLGATNTVSHPITVTAAPANQPPTAVFTSSVSNLAASFNGSTSTDSDGTIAAYAWSFGDTQTGTGATVAHSYAAAGTYTVSLTVTDNLGATGTVAHSVTVVAPPANVIAQDNFDTAIASGWGTAVVGGPWTIAGTATSYLVADGVGQQIVSAGSTKTSSLSGVSATSTDLTASFTTDKASTGGGIYVSAIGRDVVSTNYQARIWLQSSGAVQLQLLQGATALQLVNVPGITYAPGTVVQVRLQVFGTSPTTVRAKVWTTVQAEPTAWQASVTDATAALQVAGSVGLRTYLSGTATTTPVTARFDNLSVSPQQ